jgi:hypothetical protein
MIDPDKETLVLKLTVNEINSILISLQELPAKISNPLTRKIQVQANEQLEELNKEESDKDSTPSLEVVK